MAINLILSQSLVEYLRDPFVVPSCFCYILMIYILDPSAYGFGNARGFLSSTCAEELWVEIEWFTEHLETA